MKVVHVVWSLEERTGGLARAVALLANTQARSGLSVAVLATTSNRANSEMGIAGLDNAVEVRLFARSRLTRRLAGSRDLRRWLRTNLSDEDTVHVHAVWDLPAISAARVARRRRTRLVMSPHGSLEPFDVRKHALAKRILGPLLVRPSLNRAIVHCTTNREADSLVSYGASPSVQVIPLPAGDIEPAQGWDVRRDHGLGVDDLVLLFLGRVNYKKGLGHLIEAMGRMETKPHLLIAGSGEPDYEDGIRRLARDCGVEARVVWLGWIEDARKADLFAAADLFVLLSDAENYGIAVIEALQCGIAVVASDQVGIATDLARRGAVLIASREPARAAAQLDDYLRDGDLRESVVEAAGRALDEELATTRLEREYRDLALGRDVRA